MPARRPAPAPSPQGGGEHTERAAIASHPSRQPALGDELMHHLGHALERREGQIDAAAGGVGARQSLAVARSPD